ncbi:10787_t:CDS:2, partial [Scutellospora calospora]
MNLFIGILSNLINDDEHKHIAYLNLLKEIIVEIELFYLLPHQRRKENWFPLIVFYECQTLILREHILYIKKNWKGYKKPYFSENLNRILRLPEEPPNLEQIQYDIINLNKSQDNNKVKDPSKSIDEINSLAIA